MARLTVILLAVLIGGCGGAVAQRTDVPAPPTIATPAPTANPADERSGVITFGTAYDPDTLLIPKPLTRFKRTTKAIAWSAQLRDAAGATTIEVVLASVSQSGAEAIIWRGSQELASPDFDLIANKADLAALAENRAGTYVLRYVREGTVLAEGTFTLIK